MFFKLFSYLNFLLKSTNEHGVHSPFVFNFVARCLYPKKKFHDNKTVNVLLKSIGHFKFRHVEIDNNPEVANLVRVTFPAISFHSSTVDLFYTEVMDISKFVELLSEGKLHNDSMVLIDGIYRDKHRQKNWKNLITSPNITVSIDMFHCGAIFIRKEQVKEHFTIRI